MFELSFYQDQNTTWKHKPNPIEVDESDSDRVIEFLIYKNYYVLIKILNVFLGNLGKQDCKYTCRLCLTSYTNQNTIIKHKQQCEQKEITSIRT